jgi:hypothetical protein
MHHYRVLRVIDVCYASSLGPMRRLCVLLNPMHRRWAPLCYVVGPYASLLGPTVLRWALCFVVGSYVLSLGPTHCCWSPKRRFVGESGSDRLHRPRVQLAAVDFESPLLGSTRR